jgi:hypothetical protein
MKRIAGLPMIITAVAFGYFFQHPFVLCICSMLLLLGILTVLNDEY